nr:975_t:CDS:2 [Entrophospora candida]
MLGKSIPKSFILQADKWIDKVENADSFFIHQEEGLDRICDTVMRLAEVEGLKAHRKAVHARIKDISNQN